MNLTRLNTINFRNIGSFDGIFSDSVTIFLGDNAQGKTNLIEAIYIIGSSKSFRRTENDQLIKINEEKANIKSEIIRNDLKREVIFEFYTENRKNILINGQKIKKTSDYLGHFNITLFCPEDLNILKGDAAGRRRFLDLLLCQTDKIYLHNFLNYQKILKQRNFLLKEIAMHKRSIASLEPWDDQLSIFATKIFAKRSESIDFINNIANNIHKSIANDEFLTISYLNSIAEKDDYLSCFKRKLTEIKSHEIQRGLSLIGPHRDDLSISINNQNVRFLGSQGQQRTVAISLRMAEMEYIYQNFSEYPILLLDDIFSELDDKRKQYLFDLFDKKIQIFLTGTRLSDFSKLSNHAAIFGVKKGVVKQL